MSIDLWAIDDAGLDVYQFRLLCHIARVGICWQSVRTLAKHCNMSVGKASEARNWLEANGHITIAVDQKTNTIGYQVALQYRRSPDEQTQPNCSPHEHQRSPHEHQRSPHEQKTITIRQSHEGYISPDPEPITAIKTALSKTTKTPLWASTEEEYDQAAYLILGHDCNEDDVKAFGEWWKTNTYYDKPGKPYLKSLVSSFPDFLESRNGYKNGAAQPIHDPQFEAMLRELEVEDVTKR